MYWNEQGVHTCLLTCTYTCAQVALGYVYAIPHCELHTFAALSSQRSTYSFRELDIHNAGRAFAESIATNPDIALVDLGGVHLSPHVDVLGVSAELRDNRTILAHVQAQRTVHQRVKSARGGTR
jgi:hypothetical protein